MIINKIRRINFIIIILFLFNNAFSQNYYETSFENLKDTIYYPKIDRFINEGKFDSILFIANDAYDFYYKKNEKDRALYVFNLCIYFPSGYGKANEAIPIMEKKLDFLRINTDTLNVHFGSSLFIYANAHIRKFELGKALIISEKAIALIEKIKDVPPLHLASVYKTFAFLNVYLYKNKRAYELGKLGLNAFFNVDTTRFSVGKKNQILYDIAYSYMTFAALMKQTGQIGLTHAFNKKTIEVFSELPTGKENLAISYNNTANSSMKMGMYKDALKFAILSDSIIVAENFQKKLKISFVSTLSNKGAALMHLKRYEDADKVFRKLEKFINSEFNEKEPLKGDNYISIAKNFKTNNKLDSALFYYKKAENYKPKNKLILPALAEISALKNNFEDAVKYSKKNINIYLKDTSSVNNIPNSIDFLNALEGNKATYLSAKYYLSLYEQNKNQENLVKAIKYSLLCDTLIGKHRDATLIGGDDANLAKDYHNIANIGIRASYKLYNLSQDEKYINYFLKFITQSTAFKLNAEVKQTEENSSEQIKLLEKIRILENKQLALNNNSNKKYEQGIADSLLVYKMKAFELSFNLQDISNEIVSNDLFSEIKHKDIQKVLQENENLVAYFKADNKLFSILIGKNTIKINSVETGKQFDKDLKQYYKSLKTGSKNLAKYSKKMYSYLLSSYEKELENCKKLIVIPDGELAQIPFEALVINEDEKQKYLIKKLSISYNYSIFLWLRSRKFPKESEQLSFVGFAPVFLKDNETISENNPLRYDNELRYNYSEIRDGNNLKPLPYSEKEVIDIQKLFAKNGKKAKIFLKEKANEKNLKQNLSDYSIVHIATHGYSSKKDPKLSGLFMYNSDKNDSKNITNDGFVYLGEIFTMKPDANLVVLSACKSGIGKIAKGEGVLALPRAFIFAGVPNLVASLWKVHDKKTKILMIDFYENIISGKSYSESLRQAKLNQIKKGELPVDWSSFILIGE